MVKQIIVMRKDLNMRKGKMVAQGAHASMAVLLNAGEIDVRNTFENNDLMRPIPIHTFSIDNLSPVLRSWIEGLFTKICVSVDSEEELLAVYNKAKEAGLLCALITDAGKTEFDGVPTNTCCAVGPADDEDLKPITGHLKLL